MLNVLSLFDGISCGQIALRRLNIDVNKYFASEINKDSIIVTKKNFPKTIQLGDVCKIDTSKLPKIDLLMGGSPCQDFSSVNPKGKGLDGKKSKLFYEFVRILKEVKPKWFLLENVIMRKEWQDIITNILNVKPIKINSSLVSAQNRKRLYWTNISNLKMPYDKKINLNSILCKEHKNIKLVPFVIKKLIIIQKKYGYIPNKFNPYNCCEIKNKSPCLTSQGNSQTKSSSVIIYSENNYFMLNSLEWERLQTLPDNYTKMEEFSESKRKNIIGDSWTVDIISHILSHIPLDVNTKEVRYSSH